MNTSPLNAGQGTRRLGAFLAIFAASLWGVSGTCGQFLFDHRDVQPEWLVTVRLFIAGGLLLLFSACSDRDSFLQIWRSPADAVRLLAFGVYGMLGVQYTYFKAISYSNAATATVLQYLGPVLIAIYLSALHRRPPRLRECLAILLAVTGTYLLVTHGDFRSVTINRPALFWGIGSALGLAVYTVQPVSLLHRYPAANVIGWGMMIGASVFMLIHPVWNVPGTWDMKTLVATSFIIIPGCLIAFYCYLSAVRVIGSQKTSLYATAEPLSAAILATLWLKVSFTPIDWLGTACILATMLLLVESEQQELEEPERPQSEILPAQPRTAAGIEVDQ